MLMPLALMALVIHCKKTPEPDKVGARLSVGRARETFWGVDSSVRSQEEIHVEELSEFVSREYVSLGMMVS